MSKGSACGSMVRWFLLVSTAAVLSAGCATVRPGTHETINEATVSQVVGQLQDALRQASAALGKDKDNIPPFKSAEVTLQTGLVKEQDTTFKLVVLSAESKWSREASQAITITLGPPPPAQALDEAQTDLKDSLAAAIVSVARGLRAVRTSANPLESQKLVVEVSFTAQHEIGGGPTVKLVPVEADALWTLKDTAVQKIAVTFEPPDKDSGSGSKHRRR